MDREKAAIPAGAHAPMVQAYRRLMTEVARSLGTDTPPAKGQEKWAATRSQMLKRLAGDNSDVTETELQYVAFYGDGKKCWQKLRSENMFGPVAAALGIWIEGDGRELLGELVPKKRVSNWRLAHDKFINQLELDPKDSKKDSKADALWTSAEAFQSAAIDYTSEVKGKRPAQTASTPPGEPPGAGRLPGISLTETGSEVAETGGLTLPSATQDLEPQLRELPAIRVPPVALVSPETEAQTTEGSLVPGTVSRGGTEEGETKPAAARAGATSEPLTSIGPSAVSLRAQQQNEQPEANKPSTSPSKGEATSSSVRSPRAIAALIAGLVLALFWARAQVGPDKDHEFPDASTDKSLPQIPPSARTPAKLTSGVAATTIPKRDGPPCQPCRDLKETSVATCGKERKPRDEKPFVVPFVWFDRSDDKAYSEVACEFWRKSGTRVKRISCDDFSKSCLERYPGGVFAWQPGHPTAKDERGLEPLGSKNWNEIANKMLPAAHNSLLRGTYGQRRDQEESSQGTTPLFTVPFKLYPWAIYYHKKTIQQWNEHRKAEKKPPLTYLGPVDPANISGPWRVPSNWQQLTQTANEIHDMHLPAFAFSFGDPWTAMGMFDILNVRVNGYDRNEQTPGNDPWKHDIEKVLGYWWELVPYYPETWQKDTIEKSADQLANGKVGMYFIGSFFLKHFERKRREEFGIVDFPLVDEKIRDSDAVYAPIDNFVMSKAKPDKDQVYAAELLTFLGNEVAAFTSYNKENNIYLPVSLNSLRAMANRNGTLQARTASLVISQVDRSAKIAGFSSRRTWGMEGKDVTPHLEAFLAKARIGKAEEKQAAMDDFVKELAKRLHPK